jgi:hypothetical protein
VIDWHRLLLRTPFLLSAGGISELSWAANLQTVALTGQPAPGTVGGAFEQLGSQFDLNDAGHVAFLADLGSSPPPGGSRQGIWSGGAGHLQLVARSGAPAPDLPFAANFGDLRGAISLNNRGHITISPNVVPASGSFDSIYSNASGSLQLIALEGRPVPTTALQASFESFGQVNLDDSGASRVLRGTTKFYAPLCRSARRPSKSIVPLKHANAGSRNASRDCIPQPGPFQFVE